jgi:hypothetical protein
MTGPTWYRVRFAGVSVALRLDHARAASLVELVLGDAQVRGRGAADVTLRIAPGAQPEHVVLRRGRQRVYEGECNGALALALLDQTVRGLVQGSRRGLVLHAGAVGRRGGAVLLPGDAGAGKTTLTAWLVGRGFDYLTDELVFLRDRSLLCEPFRRALNVKQGDGPALDGIVKFDTPAAALRTPQGYLVTPPRHRRGPASPFVQAVIFPRYEPGTGFSLLALSPGESALRLMSALVNTRLRHDRGFTAITYLARSCPAYSLSYGDVAQLERHFGELETAAGLARTRPRRPATRDERR